MRSAKGFTLGFTLIELMVVISIIAILTLITLVNFKSFSQEQQLKKAVGEIQTYLRLAQSNATSSVKCNGSGLAKWIIKFNTTNIELLCGDVPTLIQPSLSLQNITISSITAPSCTGGLPVITYAPLTGTPTVSGLTCTGSVQNLTITLSPTTGSPSSFKISTGGAIDAQ